MKLILNNRPDSIFETEELKGFRNSMVQLHMLLLILVMLYFFIPTRPVTNPDAAIITMVAYTVFILAFRFIHFHNGVTRWQLAIETWAMIAFITMALWNTGMMESPLVNLYLLVIIACAIALGKVMTMLEVALITSCFLYLGYATYSTSLFMPQTFTVIMAKLSPFLLVAYVTSMLSADILAAKRKITVMSHTDDLTGLLNMRAFNIFLEKEIARAVRYKHPFTVVMIDVDQLKPINDHYGHLAGSRLLRVVAGSIKDCVRASDVLARYGGDEFVILMTETTEVNARVAAERVRTAIENTSFDMNGNRISTSVSIGIASFPACVEEAEEVLQKADVALYESKKSGRNRVTYYDKELEEIPACA